MKQGVSPLNATRTALMDIYKLNPDFSGAIVAVNTKLEYAAACVGFSQFEYCINTGNGTVIITMGCSAQDLFS